MRHQVAGRKLNRSASHRRALMKNLTISMIRHGRIKTTLPKAKELRSYVEKLVTIAKKDTLAARRQAFDWLRDKKLVSRLFTDYAKRYVDRSGGYTRIIKMGPRLGDAAEMAIIEFISVAATEERSAKGAQKKTTKKAATAKKAKPSTKKKTTKAASSKKTTTKKASKTATKKKSTAKKAAKKKTTKKSTKKS